MSSNVLIFTELGEDGDVRASTAELFGIGRSLADELGGAFVAAVFGEQTQTPEAHVAELGVDRILTAEDPALAKITVDGYSRALDAAIDALIRPSCFYRAPPLVAISRPSPLPSAAPLTSSMP